MLTTFLIALTFATIYAATARASFLAGHRAGRAEASQHLASRLLATAADHRASYDHAHDLDRARFTKAEVAGYFRGLRKSAVVALKMVGDDLL